MLVFQLNLIFTSVVIAIKALEIDASAVIVIELQVLTSLYPALSSTSPPVTTDTVHIDQADTITLPPAPLFPYPISTYAAPQLPDY